MNCLHSCAHYKEITRRIETEGKTKDDFFFTQAKVMVVECRNLSAITFGLIIVYHRSIWVKGVSSNSIYCFFLLMHLFKSIWRDNVANNEQMTGATELKLLWPVDWTMKTGLWTKMDWINPIQLGSSRNLTESQLFHAPTNAAGDFKCWKCWSDWNCWNSCVPDGAHVIQQFKKKKNRSLPWRCSSPTIRPNQLLSCQYY